jgi:hypothetical protein
MPATSPLKGNRGFAQADDPLDFRLLCGLGGWCNAVWIGVLFSKATVKVDGRLSHVTHVLEEKVFRAAVKPQVRGGIGAVRDLSEG